MYFFRKVEDTHERWFKNEDTKDNSVCTCDGYGVWIIPSG